MHACVYVRFCKNWYIQGCVLSGALVSTLAFSARASRWHATFKVYFLGTARALCLRFFQVLTCWHEVVPGNAVSTLSIAIMHILLKTLLSCRIFMLSSSKTLALTIWQAHLSDSPVAYCDDLGTPENGAMTLYGRMVNSVATYSCHDAYLLNGDSTRVCMSNGKWSGGDPVCTGKPNTHSYNGTCP